MTALSLGSVCRLLALKANKARLFACSGDFRRRKVRHWLWPVVRRVYSNVEYLGIQTSEGGCILAHTADRLMTVQLLKLGRYTSSNLPRALALLPRTPRPGWFLDVGANIGTETVSALMSGRFAHAIAIEPESRNNRLLRANLVINGLADRVTVYDVAASNASGPAVLRLSESNRGDHRVSPTGAPIDGHEAGEVVQTSRLDDLLRVGDVRPQDVALVWVDTQGYDGFVLDGARSLIEARIPFVIEFWPTALRGSGGLETALEIIEESFDIFFNLSAEEWREPHSVRTIRGLASSLRGPEASVDLMLGWDLASAVPRHLPAMRPPADEEASCRFPQQVRPRP